MTTAETVIMISLGPLLIRPVSGKNLYVTFLVGLVLIITLRLIEYVQLKWNVTESLFTGKSKIVIEHGEILQDNLKKLRLTVDTLEMRLREKGIKKIEDVKFATIEASGELGYLLREEKQYATKEDVQNIQQTLNQLLNHLQLATDQRITDPPPKESSTNLFTELKERHIPPHQKRLQ
ncbi:DUF421 domain-containing protein [Fictibacillus nanhaiensis]|nr:DUF421 domain-containing protein [Fictibacillus nanhaiensis]